jgi:hypothetical protein
VDKEHFLLSAFAYLFGAAVTCFLKVYVTEGNLSEIQEKETDP